MLKLWFKKGADKISLADVIYPVGAIYINTINTNPSVFLGGTWEHYAKGRTLVGVDENDASFNTPTKIGGHKEMQTHGHGVSIENSGYHGHGASTSVSNTSITGQCRVLAHPAWIGGNSGALGIYDPSSREPYPTGNTNAMAAYLRLNNTHGHTAYTSVDGNGAHGHNATVNSAGNGNAENLQPYITVYFWRRTA